MKTLHLVLVLTALLLSLAACTVGSGREIGIVAGERNSNPAMYFEPKRVTVRAGETVSFVVKNDGVVDHEFESDEAGIEEVIIPAR
ncbi:MAG: cupredoxin domain-containing protein, partial [Chloroflexota bacterium]